VFFLKYLSHCLFGGLHYKLFHVVLWVSRLVAADPGIDSAKEKMGDLVMKGALELVVEAYSPKFLPPAHQLYPHQL